MGGGVGVVAEPMQKGGESPHMGGGKESIEAKPGDEREK